MDEVGACNDDQRSLTHLHGEDWAVLFAQVANNIHEGTSLEYYLKEVADDWPTRWSWREVLGSTAGLRPVAPPP